MMNDGREHTGHDNICKAHSARSERDEYRICPSKLSKRELEDLYFRLIETNIQLKKTINTQQDQLKVLSTRLQRATAQKVSLGKEKNCCASSKAVIDEQKYIIADLKKSNERLSERIRLLNMKLCSARQFLKRSPPQCSSRCTKNCNFTNTSIKNSSMSALNTKMSESDLKTKVASCQYLDKASTPRKLDETLISLDKSPVRDSCDENKCKTLMEELKQKVTTLELELLKSREENTNRITKLEEEMSSVRREGARARSGRAAAEQRLQLEVTRSQDLTKQLRHAEAQCDDLTVELTIKEHKVRELETQVKAADVSSHLAKALDDHFNAGQISEPVNPIMMQSEKNNISPTKADKRSDDSGYAEQDPPLTQYQGANKLESDVMKQLTDLQSQLNSLKNSVMDTNKDHKYDSEEASCSRRRVSLNMNEDLQEKSTKNNPLEPPNKTFDLGNENDSTPRDENKDLNNDKDNKETEANDITNETEQLHDKDKKNRCQMPGPLPVNGNRRQSIKKSGNIWPDFDLHINLNKKVTETDGKTKKRKGSLKTSNEGKRSSEDKAKTKPTIKSSTEEEIYETTLNPSKVTCECPKDGALRTPNSDNGPNDTVKLKELEDVRNVTGKATISKEAVDRLKIGNGGKFNSVTNNNESCKTYRDIAIQSIENAVTKVCVNCGVGPNGLENTIIREKTTVDAEIQAAVNDCKGFCRDATVETGVRRPCDQQLRARALGNKRHRCECVRYFLGDLASTVGPQTKQTGPNPVAPRTTSSSTHNTYVVRATARRTRVGTPENTDHEISSLTDLPTERSSKSPDDYISPGEDRCVSTVSETYTATVTDYGSLSEGELPGGAGKCNMSFGEVKMKNKATGSLEQSSSTQVEEALKEISKELARCRLLLQGEHYSKVITALPRTVDPF